MNASSTSGDSQSDHFLRSLAWWIAGSVLYLQALSLIGLLNVRVLLFVPWLWPLYFTARRLSNRGVLRDKIRLDAGDIAAVLILLIAAVGSALSAPRGYDVLAYHLPYVAEWISTGSALPYYSAFSGPVGYYPGNFELLCALVLNLTHSTFLLNCVNLFSVFLLGGLTIAIANRLAVARGVALLLFAAVLVTSKASFKQFGNAYNDLFFASLLVAALYFVFQGKQSNRSVDMILAGSLAGLALGTKYAGLLYVAPLWFYVVASRRRFGVVAAFTFPLLLCGGYWYIRNWMVAGNPVYPLAVNFFGSSVFPGLAGKGAEKMLFFHLHDLRYLRQFFGAILTNGHLLLLPIIALQIWTRFRNSQTNSYFVAALASLMIYLITPLSAEDYEHVYLNFRYALTFQWLILLGPGLALLARPWGLKASSVLERFGISVPTLVFVAVGLTMLVASGFVYKEKYDTAIRKANKEYGESWAVVDSLPPSTIAFAGVNLPGPLYGRALKHVAVYVNVNERNGGNYSDYPNAEYREHPDESAWRHNLRENNVGYLWVAKDSSLSEYRWAAADPFMFRPHFESERVALFRVRLNPR